MLLSTIFEQLTFNELRHLDIGGYNESTKSIQPSDYNEILNHLNAALLKLHYRFTLAEKELVIQLSPDRTMYPLLTENAFSSGNDDWFIEDTEDNPFLQDILTINGIYNSCGRMIPLNDPNAEHSVFAPNYRSLQVCVGEATNYYVVYRTKPIPLVAPDITDQTAIDEFLAQDVLLPDVLLEALTAYIGSRVYKTRLDAESQAKAAEFMNTYEMLVADIEFRNVLNTTANITNITSIVRGWV